MKLLRIKLLTLSLAACAANGTAAQDDFKTLSDLQKLHEQHDQARSLTMGGVRLASSFSLMAIGTYTTVQSGFTSTPYTWPMIALGLTEMTDSLVDLTKWKSASNVSEQYNAFIYEVYKKDANEFKTALAEPDDVKRAKWMLAKVTDLSTYKDLVPNDADKRSIYNSTAIIKIIEVTKALAQEDLTQGAVIKKLQDDFNALKNKCDDPDTKKKVVLLNDKLLDAAKAIGATTQQAARTVASLDGAKPSELVNPANPAQPTAKAQDFTKEYEKFHTDLEKAARFYGEAYVLAVNLGLHGKDQERMQKGVTYLDAVVTVSKAITTKEPHDIMAAAISVTSLFGKKTAGDPKHEQIMAAFDKMFELQTAMLQNQARIYEVQVKNYELLVSLYDMTEKGFVKVDDTLKVLLGGQAVLQKAVVDYSTLLPELQACDQFFNSRIECPPSELEDVNSIPKCLKRSLKTHFEVPARTMNYAGVFGQYNAMAPLQAHFTKHVGHYRQCKAGLDRIFGIPASPVHSAFLTAATVADNSTGYEKVVATSYEPLLELTRRYYSHNNDTFLLYLLLSSPAAELGKFDVRLSAASRWLADISNEKALTPAQVMNNLGALIYVPNLEKYVSIGLQMLPYQEFVPDNADAATAISPEILSRGVFHSTNDAIANRLYIMEKLVSIAIAQQSLLSGEPFIGTVDYFLEPRNSETPEAKAAAKLLRHNTLFRTNYLKQSLRNMLTYQVNRDGKLTYPAQFTANLKLYEEYLRSGFEKCGKGDCTDPMFAALRKRFRVLGSTVVFRDHMGIDFAVSLPTGQELASDSYVYPQELKRLLDLRSLIEAAIYKSSLFVRTAIDQNNYVVP